MGSFREEMGNFQGGVTHLHLCLEGLRMTMRLYVGKGMHVSGSHFSSKAVGGIPHKRQRRTHTEHELVSPADSLHNY